MRLITRLFFLVVALGALASCGQKSAGLQDDAEAPDTTLFENGNEYMRKHQYIKARLAYQTLVNTYPDSEYTPPAFLGIADSYNQEGGTENLLQAEAQYKDFLIFYPDHEMADDVQLKIAGINYRLSNSYDRDPTYTEKTQAELKRFLNNYPDSEYVPTAEYFLREVNEILARRHHEIGEFYYKRDQWDAAVGRYEEVRDGYPNFSRLDQTLYHMAKSHEEMGRIEQASAYYAQLAKEFPFSDHFEEARERLTLLERPLPKVDEAAAARHAANVRQDDFSLLSPLRGFLQVFTGKPDIFEIARKEAQQSQTNGESRPPDQP